MTVDVESNFSDAKTVPELASLMEKFVGQLFASLQRQPNFIVRTDVSKPITNNTPTGTIVFTYSASNILKTSIWDGQKLVDQLLIPTP